MQRRLGQLAVPLLLLPLGAAAAPLVSHHPVHWFVVQQAEAPDKDFAYYAQAIEQATAEADALLQGVQAPAPTDVACCVSIDDSAIDEIDQSRLATIDSMSDFDLMSLLCGAGTCGFLVDSITLAGCGGGTQAVGCSDQPACGVPQLLPLIVTISVEAVEAGYLGHLVAHEVGHTACLSHDTSDPCDVMDPAVAPGTLQGCLTSAECGEYSATGTLGPDTCTCQDDAQAPLADGSVCTEAGGPGACTSGICIPAPEPGAGALALAALGALGARARAGGGRAGGRATQLT